MAKHTRGGKFIAFTLEFEDMQKKCISKERDYAKGLTKAFKVAFEKDMEILDDKPQRNNPKSRKRFYI